MAEQDVVQQGVAEQEPAAGDPAGRGRLVIADRAVRRMAAAAAAEVGGVVRTTPGLPGRLPSGLPGADLGGRLPQAEVTVAGHRARVRVEVAVRWGTPLPLLAAGVRERVRDRLALLAGIRADAVDVSVVQVVSR